MLLPGLLMLLPSGAKVDAKEGFSSIHTRTVPSEPYTLFIRRKGEGRKLREGRGGEGREGIQEGKGKEGS